MRARAAGEHVLPASARARVSIEAGITLGWREYVGDAGASVGPEHFGASADDKKLYAEFGMTAERAAQAAHASIATVTAADGHR
jgi:transketolase